MLASKACMLTVESGFCSEMRREFDMDMRLPSLEVEEREDMAEVGDDDWGVDMSEDDALLEL